MRFVFDTNALIVGGGSKNGPLPEKLPLYVPLVVLQELFYQLARPDREPRARRALQAAARHPGLVLGPGFKDVVGPCFGRPLRTWPREEGTWREALLLAADGAPWVTLRRIWNDLWVEGATPIWARLFVHMKETKKDFLTAYLDMVGELAPEMKSEFQRATAGMTRPQVKEARAARDERHLALARLNVFTELAAMADVLDADETFQKMLESQDPDSGDMRVELGRRLSGAYRGGLEFVMDVMAENQVGHLHGATRPEENDYFDLCVLASVDTHPDTFFVTDEEAWHRAAAKTPWKDQIIKWKTLQM